MSTNERDTRFQNFAKLLWDELMAVTGGYIDVSSDGLDDEWIEKYKAIIARRAYDLVYHALYCNGVDALYRPGKDYHPTVFYEQKVTEHTNEIPDLTKWPE